MITRGRRQFGLIAYGSHTENNTGDYIDNGYRSNDDSEDDRDDDGDGDDNDYDDES